MPQAYKLTLNGYQHNLISILDILLGKHTLLSIEGWFDIAGKHYSFISYRGEGKACLGAKASPRESRCSRRGLGKVFSSRR